jgi:hypothetical protein
MNGKRSLFWLGLVPLALMAVARAPAVRSAPEPQAVLQYLTVVHEDGSADFEVILKFSKTGLDKALKNAGFSEDELCAHATQEVESNFGTFSQEKHGEAFWCTSSLRMDTLQELHNHLENDFGVNVRTLKIEDKTFTLDLSWTMFPCTTADPATFGCEWSVEAPGNVGKNNATDVSGRTLTWDLASQATPMRFTAESEVGGYDPTLVILLVIFSCGCCLTILLIGGGIGVYFYLRKRNKDTSAEEPAVPDNPAPAPSPADTIKL